MSTYGPAHQPLMRLAEDAEMTQKWYADDGNAVGKLHTIFRLYKKIKHGYDLISDMTSRNAT